jgi:hypothetical protein
MRQLVKCNLLLLAGLNLTISYTPVIKIVETPISGRGISHISYPVDLYVMQKEH